MKLLILITLLLSSTAFTCDKMPTFKWYDEVKVNKIKADAYFHKCANTGIVYDFACLKDKNFVYEVKHSKCATAIDRKAWYKEDELKAIK